VRTSTFTSWPIVAMAMVLYSGVSCSGQTQAKHRVTLADQQTLKECLYMQLSPDGKMLVYMLGQEKGVLWLLNTRPGSTPVKLFEGTVPMWSPDSEHLAYYSNRSGTLQLWVLDVASGRTEQLTDLQGGIDPDPWTGFTGWYYDPLRYSWSPDGKKLVFASQVVAEDQGTPMVHQEQRRAGAAENGPQPLVLTNNTPPDLTLQGVFRHESGPYRVTGNVSDSSSTGADLPFPPRRVNQLFVVELGRKRVEQLTKDDSVYFNPAWSTDGREIACASSEGRLLVGYGSGVTNIYAIEVATGEKRALTTGAGNKRLPYWSPDGKWVAFSNGELFGAESVFVVPRQGGTALNITKKLDRSVQDFYWSADSESIVFVYRDGVSWPLARVGISSGRLDPIGDSDAAQRSYLTVARSQTIAWEQSDGSSHGTIRILPQGPASSRVLLELNPQIKDWELGSQEIVRWNNERGDELEGILIKPVGYKAGQKYPLIVDCYPQTDNAFKGNSMSGNQALASLGYAVFYPDARGPHAWMNPFKDSSFDQAARGPKGWEIAYDDVMSGVDTLIRRGIADPDRMGLLGFSNGAAIVNYLLTRTTRFKCAISVAGALGIDWAMPFFLTSPSPMIPAVVGTTPWSHPEAYVKLSTIYNVDKISTPILLADGDDDSFALPTDIELYNGLRWFGSEVTFLRYLGQGHGFTGLALEDFSKREIDFFARYLRPATLE
jgi:dipeptidyl aminopeptidase/acylaminoacyl peptidase